MKMLYIDCAMGAAGDMLTAALSECLPDQAAFFEALNAVGLPGVTVSHGKISKCGITGTQVDVQINGESEHETHHHVHGHGHHHHSSLHEIGDIVAQLKLADHIKKDVMAVYALITEAESAAHGVPVTAVHFHEVGMMDAIADITAVCLLMDELQPDQVVVSPICVGSGHVRCAHGVLPVPAPATAYLLQGCPIYGGRVKSELCTPTGAALLKYFADGFGELPTMSLSKIGYGMGHKDFEQANGLRVTFGETEFASEDVIELCCNVDDMTGEAVGFATQRFFEGGALEVYTAPIYMKKNRPGIELTILCQRDLKEKMLELVFKHTTTIGVRELPVRRYVLERHLQRIETPFGAVTEKIAEGFGAKHRKIEYEDLARIAGEKHMSIESVREALLKLQNPDEIQL